MSGIYWIIGLAAVWSILTFTIWCMMRSASRADDAAERWMQEELQYEEWKRGTK